MLPLGQKQWFSNYGPRSSNTTGELVRAVDDQATFQTKQIELWGGVHLCFNKLSGGF